VSKISKTMGTQIPAMKKREKKKREEEEERNEKKITHAL
jgi:hypothetical protein